MIPTIFRFANRTRISWSARVTLRIFVAATFIAALFVAIFPTLKSTSASSPAGGTINSNATTPVTWTGTGTGGGALNAPLGLIGGEDLCQEGVTCDTFTLTVGGTPSDWSGKLIRIKIEWLLPTTDYDLYIHKDSNSGSLVGSSGRGATSPTEPLTWEDTTIDPSVQGTGVYTVHAVYYAATAVDQYHGSATIENKPAPQPTPTPSTEAAPRYYNYPAPPALGNSAGEPTIGVNWDSGYALFLASLQTLRVKWDDTASPAPATWDDVSATNTSLVTSDPILFTDSDAGPHRTNRTFVSQLLGKTSAMSFTDDDGANWNVSQGSGINSGVDHQTVGGGPYAKNPDGSLKGGAIQRPGPNGQLYPNAIYYASQDVGLAEIGRSDDGGFTFGVAVPMWTLVQCDGLHGHIKVAPDGTVYVPNKSCGGKQGVAVSEDNGLTWSIRTIDGSTAGDTDPSVGIGADGTVYFGWADGDGHAGAAVSHDRGLSWEHVQDVGASQGIQNTVFPAVIAGDSDRAAFFFLGSTTPGANGRDTDLTFPGTWFGYIATTFDGGATWVTANATPNDPVQRGVVCTNGPSCPDGSRGLLDFNDLTVDKQGRVLAAYADGCVTGECIRGVDRNGDGRLNNADNDNAAKATIIRQVGGKRLFAAYDPPVNATPEPPQLVATRDGDSVVNLAWSVPDDGGSPITGYRLYRGVQGGAETLLATFGADVNSYTDNDAGGASYYYRVTAANANGEGASSTRVVPTSSESPCTGLGVTVLTDPAGDSLDQLASHDIRSVQIAEPYSADGAKKLVFTLKMADLSDPLTPNTTWRIYFTGADNNGYFVDMRTDGLGAVSFKYGTYIHNADNTAGTATTVGNLDAGSKYDTQTEAITLVVSNSKIGNPQAGARLSRLFVRVPVVAVVPDNANYSSPNTGVGYTLIGNAACQARPAAPSGLTAANAGKGSVTLNWIDNSDNEENFLVERSTTVAGGYIQIATLAANARSYTDNTAFRKTTYFYRVRASNAGGKSNYSNVTSIKTK